MWRILVMRTGALNCICPQHNILYEWGYLVIHIKSIIKMSPAQTAKYLSEKQKVMSGG